MNILLVEDDLSLQKLLVLHLSQEKWRVTLETRGDLAIERLQKEKFDLVVLDWMLEGELSGLDVCKSISRRTQVLMLTARNSATDIVSALESGADDYVTKPFDPAVLVARIRALKRRTGEQKVEPEILKVKDLEVSPKLFEARCQGKPIELTRAEFVLLVAMIQSPGNVLSRSSLLSTIQQPGVTVVERTIDTHVYTLRKKLGPCGDFIETIRGVGYRVNRG